MADKLKEIPAKILEWWNKFTTRQKSIIIGAAAVVIFAFAIIMYVMSKPQYVRLVTCETTAQASEIIDTLDSAGILHVGSGKNLEEAKQPQIIEKNGKKIGFLGASRVFPTGGWAAGSSHPGMFSAYDTASVVQEIQKVKKECDYLVVYVHWGIERNTQPEAYQREMGHQYIDAGADLVVGSHPHVLQGIELYHGKWILYSLGNFVFGSSIPETMLVQASVDAQGETALSIVPATSSAGYTRELDVEKKEAFYQKIQGLSDGVQIDENGKVQVQ